MDYIYTSKLQKVYYILHTIHIYYKILYAIFNIEVYGLYIHLTNDIVFMLSFDRRNKIKFLTIILLFYFIVYMFWPEYANI